MRLTSPIDQSLQSIVPSKSTIGYNVETIKIYTRRLYMRHCHKITLWDCGGQPSLRSLWSYHFSNTSLLLWIINDRDRSRLETNLNLLLEVLSNPLLYQIPVLIVLYHASLDSQYQNIHNENNNENLLTTLEVAFHFLATLSNHRANTFKWQVISINLNKNSNEDLEKIQQSFEELMDL